MIDSELSLSFNIGVQNGTYALLLGSGVSRSAGIPTGWEVTLDLVEKLAAMQGEDTSGNAEQWYQSRYGEQPNYSDVISAIAPKPASQQQLLRGYFEPTEQEQGEGKKLPTRAHRAIANLVKQKHIRVILTTNFDRLLESALEAAGIAPVVISTADGVKGAPPLAHSTCTIVKIHGDYLDHRIKNSPEALSKYNRPLNQLIDQIFDEYGLIICGWSGEYDLALRSALVRRKSRRYPVYWAGFSEPSGEAAKITSQLSAEFIKIQGADDFFERLEEKLYALESFNRPHPLTIQAAIATLKRYLSEPKHRIALHDFLVDEAKYAKIEIDRVMQEATELSPTIESVAAIMKGCEAACERLIHLFAVGVLHANAEHKSAFWAAFKHLSKPPENTSGYEIYSDLKRYPSLLICYATGYSSFEAERFDILEAIASKPVTASGPDRELVVAPAKIYVQNVLDGDQGRLYLENFSDKHTPLNDYLRSMIGELYGIDEDNKRQANLYFDAFEYFWCLLHVDYCLQSESHVWTPYGSFSWRQKGSHKKWLKPDLANLIRDDALANWAPLVAGLFGGNKERLKAAVRNSNEILLRISDGLH